MLALLEMLGIWAWFIDGVVLMIAEVFAPGAFLLWLGLAAFLVGVLSLVVDWSWQAQFIAFAVFAVAAGRPRLRARDADRQRRRHRAHRRYGVARAGA